MTQQNNRVADTSMARVKAFVIQYQEALLYLIFGVASTIVSIFVYWLFTSVVGLNALIANVISWIAAVSFAYITNRLWVFQSRVYDFKNIVAEIGKFVSARLLTLGIEELGLWILIDLLTVNSMFAKLLMQVVVIVLNYVFSKLVVFSKKKPS